MNFLKYLNPFRKPSAEQEAARLQAEYALKGIEHQEAAAFNSHLAAFYKSGVDRLQIAPKS